jgi:S-(hydroxymethyl)glutathione dehydrogenase/alcohol dehydrogenase
VFQPEQMVSRRYPLTEADEAYQALARGEIVGRAIVMPGIAKASERQ